jgi:hypothetical protein
VLHTHSHTHTHTHTKTHTHITVLSAVNRSDAEMLKGCYKHVTCLSAGSRSGNSHPLESWSRTCTYHLPTRVLQECYKCYKRFTGVFDTHTHIHIRRHSLTHTHTHPHTQTLTHTHTHTHTFSTCGSSSPCFFLLLFFLPSTTYVRGILQESYKSVTRVLQECYTLTAGSIAFRLRPPCVRPVCYKSVTRVLQ